MGASVTESSLDDDDSALRSVCRPASNQSTSSKTPDGRSATFDLQGFGVMFSFFLLLFKKMLTSIAARLLVTHLKKCLNRLGRYHLLDVSSFLF